MESSLTSGISNSTVCDFLYVYMIFVFLMAALQVVNGFTVVSVIKPMYLKVLILLLFLGLGAFMVMFGISLYILCERGLKPQITAEEEKYRKMTSQMNSGAY